MQHKNSHLRERQCNYRFTASILCIGISTVNWASASLLMLAIDEMDSWTGSCRKGWQQKSQPQYRQQRRHEAMKKREELTRDKLKKCWCRWPLFQDWPANLLPPLKCYRHCLIIVGNERSSSCRVFYLSNGHVCGEVNWNWSVVFSRSSVCSLVFWVCVLPFILLDFYIDVPNCDAIFFDVIESLHAFEFAGGWFCYFHFWFFVVKFVLLFWCLCSLWFTQV